VAYQFFPGTPFGAYQGKTATRAFQRGDNNGYVIVNSIDWSDYATGGEALGSDNPNFAVLIDWSASANVPQPFILQSLFVDNANSVTPVFVFFPDTLYTVEVEAGASGWFPVITNSPQAYVIAQGLVTNYLPVTTVMFTNLFIPPYTAVAQPNFIGLKLASPALGGGAALSGIAINAPGQWCNNASAITIAGGGGSGAAAQGALDSAGQFTAVNLGDAGENYSGPPAVTYTGGYTLPFTWTSGNVWNKGTYVLFQSGVYLCINTVSDSRIGNPYNEPYYWQYQAQLTGVAIPPSFTANIGLAGTAIITDGYGVPTLGDQVLSLINNVSAVGVFSSGLFGSPYASGFIYINSADVRNIGASGSNAWRMQSSDGDVILWNFVTAAGMVDPAELLNVNGVNIKLDATKTWELNCEDLGADFTVSHQFVYTLSQQ
jgi:hypothetical protein